MLAKFFIYGFLGWVVEVCFTGAHAAVLGRDRSATAKTYLWMHPIYGAGMLGLEWLGSHLGTIPWLERAAIYVAAIYLVEFTAGICLRELLGRCPWDYGRARLAVKGVIRLDYAPAWYVAALLFDPVRVALDASLHAVTVHRLFAVAASGWG